MQGWQRPAYRPTCMFWKTQECQLHCGPLPLMQPYTTSCRGWRGGSQWAGKTAVQPACFKAYAGRNDAAAVAAKFDTEC